MTSHLTGVALVIAAVALWHPERVCAQAQSSSWLDRAKPDAWNKPGLVIPAAPAVEDVDSRCRGEARPPELPEDKRVREAGWDLMGGYQGGWEMLLIGGAAGYDGMCRPLRYQYFLFVRGAFAGTLSPQPMDSRTDGAAGRVGLQAGGRLTAEYQRYASSDPLCCPSRTTSVTFEVVKGGAGKDRPFLRPLSPTRRRTVDSAYFQLRTKPSRFGILTSGNDFESSTASSGTIRSIESRYAVTA